MAKAVCGATRSTCIRGIVGLLLLASSLLLAAGLRSVWNLQQRGTRTLLLTSGSVPPHSDSHSTSEESAISSPRSPPSSSAALVGVHGMRQAHGAGGGASVAHIALVSYGWGAKGYEDNTTIKGRRRSIELALRGIFRLNTCPLVVHFVTGDPDERMIRGFLRSYMNTTRINGSGYVFHALNETRLAAYMAVIGHKPTHRTGAAGNVKFFYPLLFPGVEKMLMLDTDVLIGTDICELWRLFDSFSPTQLFAFAPQWPSVHPAKDNQLNAGVGLLHLARMRDREWLQLAKASIDHWAAKHMRPPCCAHGDQSVFHMIRFLRPSALGLLPRWWNINKCHGYQNIHRNPRGSFVGIVHLGCCKMCTMKKIGARWAALLIDIESFNSTHEQFTLKEYDSHLFTAAWES